MAWDPRKAGAPARSNLPPGSPLGTPPPPMAPPAPIWPGVPGPSAGSPPLPPAPALPPARPLGPFHEPYAPAALAKAEPPTFARTTQPQAPVRHNPVTRVLLGLRAGLAGVLRHLWPAHAAAPDWGPTSFGLSAPLTAFLAYLGWWFTGVIVYFNERQNRFVRFHAYQAIVYTGLLSIVSVLGYVAASLCEDVYLATHQPVFQTLARGVAALVLLGVIFAWFIPLIAAATGYRLRIPFIAPYAERYSKTFDTTPHESTGEP